MTVTVVPRVPGNISMDIDSAICHAPYRNGRPLPLTCWEVGWNTGGLNMVRTSAPDSGAGPGKSGERRACLGKGEAR